MGGGDELGTMMTSQIREEARDLLIMGKQQVKEAQCRDVEEVGNSGGRYKGGFTKGKGKVEGRRRSAKEGLGGIFSHGLGNTTQNPRARAGWGMAGSDWFFNRHCTVWILTLKTLRTNLPWSLL